MRENLLSDDGAGSGLAMESLAGISIVNEMLLQSHDPRGKFRSGVRVRVRDRG